MSKCREELSIITLRNHLISSNYDKGFNYSKMKVIQACLNHYIKGDEIKMIKAPKYAIWDFMENEEDYEINKRKKKEA